MKPTISVIVPIFNMELYITRCLDSLLSQSFEDLEIITVNDGSTDSSGILLERYAQADHRVVVVHKENGGVSSARNEGLRKATGTYIGFVDPDDWVNTGMYEVMYRTAVEEDADIVMCTYMREFGTHTNEKKFPLPNKVIYRKEEVRSTLRRLIGPLNEELATPDFLDAWGTVWSKLYRASLIKGNGLQFIDLAIIGSNEDSLFNIHAFYQADSFVFLNRPFYHYWRSNSASITSTFNPLLQSKFEKLYNHMDAFILDKNLSEEYHLALKNRICVNSLGLGLNLISKGNTASMFNKIFALRALISGERITQSFDQFDIRYCPLTWRLFFLCTKLKFAAGLYLMLQVINRVRVKKTRGVSVGTSSNITGRNRDESRRLGNHDYELLSKDGSDEYSV
jgi:glycosyltransferase involved in cell wall biosynthesis